MIPNKLYIGTVTLSSNAPSEEHLLPDWHLRPNPKIANVEYIRKDALIEWASNRLGQVSDMGFDDGDVEHGYTRALQDIIDKINSL